MVEVARCNDKCKIRWGFVRVLLRCMQRCRCIVALQRCRIESARLTLWSTQRSRALLPVPRCRIESARLASCSDATLLCIVARATLRGRVSERLLVPLQRCCALLPVQRCNRQVSNTRTKCDTLYGMTATQIARREKDTVSGFMIGSIECPPFVAGVE